jgi:hypothetical protein
LQGPREVNENNLNEIWREASRHFGKKKREYLKEKSNDFESKSKNQTITDMFRGKNKFEKGYQTRTNLVKDGGAAFLRIFTKF